MKLIAKLIHPEVKDLNAKALHRRAARAIALKGDSILLLYTKRYNDYSLPGGGIDQHEDLATGLIREIKEETGANNIRVLEAYGIIEEYRPYYKSDYDLLHMTSHLFLCDVDSVLGATQMEDYEIKNGMSPIWINIHEAIAHNQKVVDQNEKTMGLSIERETLVLKKIVHDFL